MCWKELIAAQAASQVNSEGVREVFKLSMETKVIYSYMYDQYIGFSKVGQKFFQTQKTIGELCGVSSATVKRSQSILLSLGLLSVDRTVMTDKRYNSYIVTELHSCKGLKLLRKPPKRVKEYTPEEKDPF